KCLINSKSISHSEGSTSTSKKKARGKLLRKGKGKGINKLQIPSREESWEIIVVADGRKKKSMEILPSTAKVDEPEIRKRARLPIDGSRCLDSTTDCLTYLLYFLAR
ncbi:unnamed protein product, partial [Ilex paraguariensis]